MFFVVVGFCFVVVSLGGLVWFWLFLCCLCFFACLRSFTDWCIARRQQSREQKKKIFDEGPFGTLQKLHFAMFDLIAFPDQYLQIPT